LNIVIWNNKDNLTSQAFRFSFFFLIDIVLVWLFFNILRSNQGLKKNIGLLGFFIGFSLWIYIQNIFLAFSIVIFLLLLKKRILLTKRIPIIFLISIIIGLTPIIYYNVNNDFNQIEFFSNVIAEGRYSIVPKIEHSNKLELVKTYLTSHLSNHLGGIDKMRLKFPDVLWLGYLYYSILLCSILLILVNKIYHDKKSGFFALFFIGFLIIFFLIFFQTAESKFNNSKNLLTILPFFFIIIASTFSLKILHISKIIKYSFIILTTTLIIFLCINYLFGLNNHDEIKLSWFYQQPDYDYQKVTKFLNSKNLTHVYSDLYTKRALIFESGSKIFITCHNVSPCNSQDYDYTDLVRQQGQTVYVLPYKNLIGWDELNIFLKDHLKKHNIGYHHAIILTHHIYYNFTRPVYPEEIFVINSYLNITGKDT